MVNLNKLELSWSTSGCQLSVMYSVLVEFLLSELTANHNCLVLELINISFLVVLQELYGYNNNLNVLYCGTNTIGETKIKYCNFHI